MPHQTEGACLRASNARINSSPFIGAGIPGDPVLCSCTRSRVELLSSASRHLRNGGTLCLGTLTFTAVSWSLFQPLRSACWD